MFKPSQVSVDSKSRKTEDLHVVLRQSRTDRQLEGKQPSPLLLLRSGPANAHAKLIEGVYKSGNDVIPRTMPPTVSLAAILKIWRQKQHAGVISRNGGCGGPPSPTQTLDPPADLLNKNDPRSAEVPISISCISELAAAEAAWLVRLDFSQLFRP